MAGKFKFKDTEGNERELPGDRIKKLSWQGPDGAQHDVEGHGWRGWLDSEPDVEGHFARPKFRDDEGNEHELDEPFRVTYVDDSGNEQEVEGHGYKLR